jgi:D-amino peptidase
VKILIAADMEGITGVVNWEHVDPDHAEYGRFRKLMTGDVNAAIRGALAGGATSVTVADGHHDGRNILIEELDERATLNSGSPSPLSMLEGVDQGVDGVILVGYHARMGASPAILDHTWSARRVENLWLNERLIGETGLNAAVSGHFGVPVIMVTGDQTVCAEARELLGELETVQVKRAVGRMAAECLPPAVTCRMIEEAAGRAVRRLAEGNAPAPLKATAPIHMVVELANSKMVDDAMTLPGARRLADRKIEYEAGDMLTIYNAFQALVGLAQ